MEGDPQATLIPRRTRLTYRLNLTECLKSKGRSFKVGEERGFGFAAVTPQQNAVDASEVVVFFKRDG